MWVLKLKQQQHQKQQHKHQINHNKEQNAEQDSFYIRDYVLNALMVQVGMVKIVSLTNDKIECQR